jgi:flagellar basal-body rod modification protein FlgD
MEVTGVGAAAVASPRRGLTSMTSEDFFNILISELQNQDPFEPTDTSAMVTQVSEIRSIEQSAELSETLAVLAGQQRMNGASELIGKFVQALATLGDGSQVVQEGVVTSVYFTSDGAAVLELDNGEMIEATSVVRVTTLEEIEASAAEAEEEDEEDEDGDQGDA